MTVSSLSARSTGTAIAMPHGRVIGEHAELSQEPFCSLRLALKIPAISSFFFSYLLSSSASP